MSPTMASCWPLLKPSRPGDITWRAASMKFSCLQTITTFSVLWTQKAWVLGKSDGPKSCEGTTSGLIIDKAKLMELLMPCLDTPSGVLKKKRHFDPRIQRSYTVCSLRWLGCQGWTWRTSNRCCPSCTKCSLRDSCHIAVVSVLGHYSKRAKLQRSLHCEH